MSITTEYIVAEGQRVFIGAEPYFDVYIKGAAADAIIDGTTVCVISGCLYINGERINNGSREISYGDCINFGELKVYPEKTSIICEGAGYESKLLEKICISDMDEDFPQYKRSPRIVKHLPEDYVEVKEPPAKVENKKGAWLMLLMLVAMICITVVIGMLMGRGIMMLMSVAMMIASAVFSAVRVIGDRREARLREKSRIQDYRNYLLDIRKKLNHLYQEQREALLYQNPTVSEIEDMTLAHSGRIYERALSDADFLCFSLGRTPIQSSYSIKYNADTFRNASDELLQEMREVVSNFVVIKDMPFVADLKNSHFAYVGESDNIHKQLKSLVVQLCFLQSYHDLNIVFITDGETRKEFDWLRWLPHCRLNSINTLAIISTENQRDKVLGNIASQLKQRKNASDEHKKNGIFLPYYVFIVDNPKLIISHSIMEYLQDDDGQLGISMIFTTNLKANVPENVKTVLLLDSGERGIVLLHEGRYVNTQVRLENVETIDFEGIARTLCPIIHNKGVTTQIPEMLTFFDMYGISRPEELAIEKMWASSACDKSLAVPLGARADNDYVYLNLHEKAHGPHGLIAGTTGSGKSEVIQSYILSLAINFHPYDVGFLLIDYKGGGMAKLFEKLPHLLGIITNLDGSESMRALASIKSELARRQVVFNENGVNNINDYTKLFKAGEAKEPLPHLFIISDEFAELKKEQPDFMKELVSTARIGRSLGVHLILATQKPSGIVDDQIWSNSRFKIALKVQDEADSNEILKNPDAARITKSGRAYLQIGNNEIYELFQTAWSGASYRENAVEQTFDERIYIENMSGQGELLNPDLSGGIVEQAMKTTQLDVLVARIATVYEEMRTQEVAKPWLPPLPDKLVSKQLGVISDVGIIHEYDLRVRLGMVDFPERQKQMEYVHDFLKEGNVAFFGASGYGKSVGLMNISLELAVKNSPELVQFYILDFGNSSLLALSDLPHVADYLTFDDTEKLNKFVAIISSEISRRKCLFASAKAISFEMYNRSVEAKLPALIVMIDNYDVIKELESKFEELIIKMTRDGVGVGIYTVIAASRTGIVRYSILNNIKNKIALYSFDTSDIVSVVGRSNYTIKDVRGRALVKLNEPHLMQCYMPVECSSDVEYAEKIQQIVYEIERLNTAQRPKHIPVLPDEVYMSMLEVSRDMRRLAIGLEAENVVTEYIDLSEPVQLIVGASHTGKTNLLKLVIEQLANAKLFVADSKGLELGGFAKRENVTMLEDPSVFADKLKLAVEDRVCAYEESDKTEMPREFYSKLPVTVLVIDDVDNFIEVSKSVANDMEKLVCSLADVGISIIATTLSTRMRGFDSITKYLKETQSGVVLGDPLDQMFFTFSVERGYKAKIDMGFKVNRGNVSRIMLPRVD